MKSLVIPMSKFHFDFKIRQASWRILLSIFKCVLRKSLKQDISFDRVMATRYSADMVLRSHFMSGRMTKPVCWQGSL